MPTAAGAQRGGYFPQGQRIEDLGWDVQTGRSLAANKAQLAALFSRALVERVRAGDFGKGLTGVECGHGRFDFGASVDQDRVELALAVVALFRKDAPHLFFGHLHLSGYAARPIEGDDPRIHGLIDGAFYRL